MVRRIAWMTDIHLEFLKRDVLDTFLDTVDQQKTDAILISGDIMPAKYLRAHLLYMVQRLKTPICFVLGNHDFYGSDLPDVRADMAALTQEQRGPVWLPAVDLVELAPDVCVIGHDGWADGRYGDYHHSKIMLNDYEQIETFRGLSFEERLLKLNQLGDEAAAYLRRVFPRALAQYRQIFILIHPPPFAEAHWYNGRPVKSDNPFLPHFTCKAVGDALFDLANAYSTHQFTVLCGHTHGSADLNILENLRVIVGGAEYGKPTIQKIFEFSV